ncbi:MAG TPA: hypothetical protein V6C58_26865 [Allocoleopsis sp.]
MKNFTSGTFVQQGDYKSFQPHPINRLWVVNDTDIQRLLDQANRVL